jgi:hypothetical protein
MAARSLLFVLLTGVRANPFVARQDVDASIAPAATTVSTDSPAGVALFSAEAVQLTDEALQAASAQANSSTDVLALFGFENSTSAANTRRLAQRSGKCKVFPGDWNYPSSLVWNIFDLLLGGALIKTTPVAAPCYKDFGVYDEAKCADITARFTTANLQ